MHNNPFTSKSFVNIWSKHFNGSKPPIDFDFISGVQFFRRSIFPIYENIGQNLTKGVDYKLHPTKSDHKSKVFLIYDVPQYFGVDTVIENSTSLKIKRVFQYEGFLMDITSFSDQDEYINAQFSSKNRREFRSNARRLEQCFNIRYEFINEALPSNTFNALFEQFYTLLTRRFAGKQTNYHHLSPKKWNYYKDLVFNMLKEKQAALLVIYNEDTPIGITLNFLSDDILFETITVFDPDYYKFSIGKTSIIKLLEWCFTNSFKISDFSKGDFEYKHKWSNQKYGFDYHILYDSKSFLSVIIAKYIEVFYKLKYFLRKKKINELYRKFRFKFSGNISEDLKEHKVKNFKKLEHFEPDLDIYHEIDYNKDSNTNYKQFVFTFAFANPEPISNIKLWRSKSDDKVIVISGSKKAQQITFA